MGGLKKLSRLVRSLRPSADEKQHAALLRCVNQLQRVHGVAVLRTDDGPTFNPVAHATDAPLEKQTFWVKQINAARLTDLGRATLFSAFKDFAEPDEPAGAQSTYQALMSRQLGVEFHLDSATQRRYAGDHTLSRGRYYAVCDEHGNDGGTLIGELRAYYTPGAAGLVRMLDCTVPGDLERVRAMGISPGNSRQLLFGLPPLAGHPHPIAQAFADLGRPLPSAVLSRTEFQIGLPLSVVRLTRERVLDLRRPEAARWLTRTLTALRWRSPHGEVACFPDRAPLDDFCDLLPELLTQERGGGGVTVAAGALLRWIGADGVIFPSARSNAGSIAEDGSDASVIGWNFVDFAGAPPPRLMAWTETGSTWPTQVGFRPYASAPADDAPKWYPEVGIVRRGAGWQIDGLRKRTDLNWRKGLSAHVLHHHRQQLSERAWGTLATLPDVLEAHGQIDLAGATAMLLFDAAMGLESAAGPLSQLARQFDVWPGLAASIDEFLTKVHRPMQAESIRLQTIYIPWQEAEASAG